MEFKFIIKMEFKFQLTINIIQGCTKYAKAFSMYFHSLTLLC